MNSLEELRQAYPKLSPAGKRQVLEALERGITEFSNELHESRLIPKIPFKVTESVTVPQPTEEAVRQFLRDNPEVKEVRVGGVIYQR